ncbi:DUF4232 domain-containing protein [Streptomyces angustmyceticus]|uniref:DUF4232 domain-containing protein n=1 Tax=Streptomyces angustmyceticus TaxID=285578 RepID=UPI0021AF4C8B|nr:DUF4232 domain-containing protein [Streptomyces angustmyceticus]
MTARRSRSRRAAYAALTLALAGSLALTGCNSHSSKSRKSKKSFSSSAGSKSSLKSKKRGFAGGGAAGAGAGAAASRRVRDCRPSTYGVTFAQQTGPRSHVTVTFKNTGSRACTLHDAPLLRFDKAKDPLPPLQGTDGTRVTVPAHGHAYAVVPTRTAAAKGTTRRSVTVAFMGASAHSVTAEPVTVNFAEKRLHLSVGNTKVTNWDSSLHGAQLAGGVAN